MVRVVLFSTTTCSWCRRAKLHFPSVGKAWKPSSCFISEKRVEEVAFLCKALVH
jgi:hypothetical protein